MKQIHQLVEKGLFSNAFCILGVLLVSSCGSIHGKDNGKDTYNDVSGERPDQVIKFDDLPEEAIAILEDAFQGEAVVVELRFIDEASRDPFKIRALNKDLIVIDDLPFDISNLEKITKVETTTEIEISGSGCQWEHHSGGQSYYYPPGCNN